MGIGRREAERKMICAGCGGRIFLVQIRDVIIPSVTSPLECSPSHIHTHTMSYTDTQAKCPALHGVPPWGWFPSLTVKSR